MVGEDIIKECAADVLISFSMIQTMKPTVHRTIAEHRHRDKSLSSESDSESGDSSLSDENEESIWSAAF